MVEQDDKDSIIFQFTSDEEDEPVEQGEKPIFLFTSDEEDECASSARIMLNEASSRRSGDEQLGGVSGLSLLNAHAELTYWKLFRVCGP